MNNEQQIVELAKKLRTQHFVERMLGGFDELLDLIYPPQPTVDWGKAIGIYFGEKLEELELIGPLDPPDHTGCTRVVYSRLRNALYTCSEDGTNGPGSEVRVINIYSKPEPAPIELGYEVAVANKDGWKEQATWKTSSGRIHIEGLLKPYPSPEVAEKDGWTFGTWHPRTVSG